MTSIIIYIYTYILDILQSGIKWNEVKGVEK